MSILYNNGNNANYIVKKGELETKYNSLVSDNITVNDIFIQVQPPFFCCLLVESLEDK